MDDLFPEYWENPSGRAIWKLLIQTSIMHILLAIFGFNHIKELALHLVERGGKKHDRRDIVPEKLRERVRHTLRYVRRSKYCLSNCLSSSMMLWYLLQRKGVKAELVIGTRFVNDMFKAHAWVEIDGYPLNAGLKVRQKYHTFGRNFVETKNS